MERIWVAQLVIPWRIAEKIQNRQIDPFEVEQKIECVVGLQARLDADPDRGLRYIAPITIGRRSALVVLYRISESDPDRYRLGSVYFVD